MGTRKRFLGWVPYQGLGTPLFPAPLFDEGNVIGHIRGPGPASLNGRHGRGNDPSLSESLLGRVRGCFGGPVSIRGDEPMRRSAVISWNSRNRNLVDQRSAGRRFRGDSRHIEKGTSLARVQPTFGE